MFQFQNTQASNAHQQFQSHSNIQNGSTNVATSNGLAKRILDSEAFYELITPPEVPRVIRPMKKLLGKRIKDHDQEYAMEKDNRIGFKITKERPDIPEIDDDKDNNDDIHIQDAEGVIELFQHNPRLTSGVNVIEWENGIIWSDDGMEIEKPKSRFGKKRNAHEAFVKGDVYVPIETMNMNVDDWERVIYLDTSSKRSSALAGIQMGSAEKILAANRASKAISLSAPRKRGKVLFLINCTDYETNML
jgi:hypothetical protein